MTTSAIAVAFVLMLSVSSCKNDPDVNIPLIKYILIDEEYMDVKSGLVAYNDSLAMGYNNDMQLVNVDGLYQDFDLYYDEAGRIEKVEIFNDQSYKALYSSYIEFTWAANTVTAQEYYGPNEPTWYKTVITFDENDKIEKIEYFDQPNKAEWYLSYYSEYTYTNKNLTLTEGYYPEFTKSGEVRQHSFRKTTPLEVSSGKGLAPTLVAMSEVTYDSKTNPFVMYPGLAILFADEMPQIYTSKNNPTNESNVEYYEGTYTWDVDYTYEFDGKGYPIEIVQFESYDGWSYMETWTIAYK